MSENKNVKMGMTPEKAMQVYTENNDSKLKNRRVQKGFSQKGLSDASGVAKRAIQTYEQGERDIDKAHLETLCKLARALECKIEDIIESEELIKLYQQIK